MMASKRVVVVVLGLAILGGIFWTSVSRNALRAEQAGGTSSRTFHSIKVTLVNSKGESGCEFYSLSPLEAGVYPGDTVVFNVENGCTASATVSFTDFKLVSPKDELTRLFRDSDSLKSLEKLTVKPGERRRIDLTPVQVKPDQLKEPHKFEYTVRMLEPAKAPRGPAPQSLTLPDGTIYYCQKPPCPPPS
jgi:hypothetical protein